VTPDWEAFCRETRVGVQAALASLTTRTERERSHGVGEGGDETIAVDAVAETVVFNRLEELHEAGHDFVVVSEEAGRMPFGDSASWWLAVDPVDGSKNAKRQLPYYSLSIAIGDGPTIGDVAYGYVFDLASEEEWTATRGGGAQLDGEPLGRETRHDRLESVALEATRPGLLAQLMPRLVDECDVVRVLGSLALSLCQLAAVRIDGVAALRPVRSVDIAAGQLIARESGARVALANSGILAESPIDLERRSLVIAANGEDGLRALSEALNG